MKVRITFYFADTTIEFFNVDRICNNDNQTYSIVFTDNRFIDITTNVISFIEIVKD